MRGFSSDTLATFLGLEAYIDNAEEHTKEIIRIIRDRLRECERSKSEEIPKILKHNIKKVVKLIDLNRVERDILIFAIYLKYYDIFDDATRTLDDLTTDRLFTVIALLLEYRPAQVKKALSPQGKLASSGLVTVDRDGSNSMRNKLDILSGDFADRMMTLEGDVEEMIRDSVRRCDDGTLELSDFDHLDKDLSLLLPYLRHALASGEKGVNILFYGQPGTGKTELTKTIAKTLGTAIYEVSYADDYDEPISGDRRLKAYKVGQSFFGAIVSS
jgi:Cdc6-like AAA superfamily ATPase